MSIDLSSPLKQSRLNPEFIGIAKKLSSSKQKRQSLEQERHQHLRLLNYKINVDLQLSKNIEGYSEKLKTAKGKHIRKMQDDYWKQEQGEIKASRLRSLSSTIKEKKQQQKRGIRNAMLHTFNKHRRSHNEEKEMHEAIQQRIKYNNELQAHKNRQKYEEVKEVERQSINAVNKFYKTVNKDSLNNYKTWISQEQTKAELYQSDIRQMHSAIEKYDKSIDKKKQKLLNIFAKIEGYTSEPLQEQSKILPHHLRDSTVMSSSRPKDILLRSSKQMKESAYSTFV